MKTLALIVFLVGVAGYVVLPYTLLTNFVALEYIFLGAGLVGVAHSLQVDDFDGQFFLLCVLAVAAAEAALGLALLVQFYRLRGNIQTLLYPLIKASVGVVSIDTFGEEFFFFLVGGLFLAVGTSTGGSTGGSPGGSEDPNGEDPDWWKKWIRVALGVTAVTAAVGIIIYFIVSSPTFSGTAAVEFNLTGGVDIASSVQKFFSNTFENPAFVDRLAEQAIQYNCDPEVMREAIKLYVSFWKQEATRQTVAWFAEHSDVPLTEKSVKEVTAKIVKELTNKTLYLTQ